MKPTGVSFSKATYSLLLIILLGFPAYAEASRTVTVGYFHNKPIVFQNDQGQPEGLYVDLIKVIAEKANWNLQFEFGSFSELVKQLDNGQIDLMTSIAQTEKRNEIYDFSNDPVLTLWGTVYVPVDSKIETVLDLNGKTISIMKRGILGIEFRKLCQSFNIVCNFEITNSQVESLESLKNGNVDAAVFNNTFAISFVTPISNIKKTPVIFSPLKAAFATRKGDNSDLIETIDQHMGLWLQDENSVYHRSLKRWMEHLEIEKTIIPIWVFGILSLIIVISGLLFIWTRVLKKQVDLRTKDLAFSNKALLEETEERKLAQNELENTLNSLELKVEERTRMLQSTNEQLVSEAQERKRAETSLKRFRMVMDQASEAIFIAELSSGRFLDVNSTASRMLGYSREELLTMSIKDVEQRFDTDPKLDEHLVQVSETDQQVMIEEGMHRRKDGSTYPVEVTISKEIIDNKNILLAVARDITERKAVENQIQTSLKEKEILLQEIHHRVKNNMQVINSLLKLQSYSIEDIRVRNILNDSQSRVYAMAAVHETLHSSESLSVIDLKTYLPKVTESIFKTYSSDKRNVTLKSDLIEVPISINQAYPLGLVINELISNAMKYAFPDEKNGDIQVQLRKQGSLIELVVYDNGVGFPEDFDWKKTESLGLRLVKDLVEQQLGGTINLADQEGTHFTIQFTPESL